MAAQDTLRTLREAVVSAAKWQHEMIPAQRLEGERLRRMAAMGVADAVRQFSGVQIKDYGGIGGLKTVNVRGMGSQHVGVFYDGVELTNAQNGQIDLGRFSLDEMEAVAVFNGQRVRLLQSARDFGAASSLYLESRTPTFGAGEVRHLRATLKAGSFSTFNPSVAYDRRLSPRLSASVNAEWMRTTGRYDFRYRTAGGYDTTATRRNGDVKGLRTEAALFGTTNKGSWRAKGYLYTSERGLPGAVVRNRFSHEDRQWDTNVFLQSSFRHRFSERHSLLLQAKWAYDYLHYLSDPAAGDVSAMYTDNTYRRQEAYASAASQWDVSERVALSAAADYAFDHVHANLYHFAFPTRHSVYAALAGRFRWGALEGQASLLYAYTHEAVRHGAGADDRRRLSPALTLTYPVGRESGLTLRAFYKDVFRLPTLNELYYTFVGSATLKPETARQFDLGATWERGAFEVKADVYYNRVKNKIVAVPTSNMFRWTMLNLGEVSIFGAEVQAAARHRIGQVALEGRATYTFERAIDCTDPGDAFYHDQIPYIPRHSGSLMASATWRRWALHYSFLYTGERYEQRANLPENFAPAWYTSDVALSCSLARWQFTAQVNNLFNQAYDVVKGYPMPGTNFRLIATFRL